VVVVDAYLPLRPAPGAAREVTPEATPEVTPEVTPEATPEATSDRLIRGFLGNLELSPADLALAPGGGWEVDQMLEALLTRAKDVGVIPQSAGRDLVQRYFDVFAANVAVLDSYEPRAYDGDLVLVHGAQASPEKLATWDRMTGGRVRAVAVAGKHELLMSPPYVHDIAACLRALARST